MGSPLARVATKFKGIIMTETQLKILKTMDLIRFAQEKFKSLYEVIYGLELIHDELKSIDLLCDLVKTEEEFTKKLELAQKKINMISKEFNHFINKGKRIKIED